MEELAQIVEKIERENDFEKLVDLFSAAANLVKTLTDKTAQGKGRLLEIIKDLDGYIEKELKKC